MTRSERNAILAIPLALFFALLVAWAGSQGGATWHGIPVLILVVAVAFLAQWVAFVPAFIGQSEHFFDITGSATYITVAGLAIGLSPFRDGRSILLLALIVIWALRLGSFLLRRVRRAGRDARFDNLKTSFARFLMTWTLQGLWVSLTLAAALTAMTSLVRKPLGLLAWLGLGFWLVGFSIEAVADWQKGRFKNDPAHKGQFIQLGLWRWSRHPNYFGEIVLWIGIAIIAAPVLQGWQYATLISPIFVILLLTRVSGIPILEKRADEKWGGQAEHESYKRRTSILIPWPPRSQEP